MSKELYLDHRGALVGLFGLGDTLVFATDHPEGQPTAVFRVNPSTGAVTSDALPTGAKSLLVSEGWTLVGGADGRLYRGPRAGGALAAFGPALPAPAAALAPLAGDRLAVGTGALVLVLGPKGDELQRFELPDAVSALASDPSGTWLVAGTTRGLVQVYETEERPAFLAAESARLHEGRSRRCSLSPRACASCRPASIAACSPPTHAAPWRPRIAAAGRAMMTPSPRSSTPGTASTPAAAMASSRSGAATAATGAPRR
ncbi:MAG: hypothetical protein R3F60_17600 [bacterium]